MEYYTITTNVGDQAIAHAIQTGATTTFKQIAVGDGNGTYYEPAKTQTALRREVWRGNAVVSLDTNNPKRVIVTATIPATIGGFTIREAGIFDTTNALMVVSKLPLSEKVAPESGASSDLVIRLYVEVSDAGAVTITVDPSAVMATKADITNAVSPVESILSAHTSNTTNPHGVTAAQAHALPDTVTALKNPTALTVGVGNGGSALTYDGSAAQSITIPKVTLSTTATPSNTLATGELYFSPN